MSVRRGVEDGVAGAAGAVAEGLRDVALADAGLADEQTFSWRSMKLQVGRSMISSLGDLRVEGEVEVLEGLAVLEAGAAQAELELLGVAPFDLVGQQPEEELAMREVVVDGLARAQLEGLQHAGQAQLLEERDQFVSWVHRSPPSVERSRSSCDVGRAKRGARPRRRRRDDVGQRLRGRGPRRRMFLRRRSCSCRSAARGAARRDARSSGSVSRWVTIACTSRSCVEHVVAVEDLADVGADLRRRWRRRAAPSSERLRWRSAPRWAGRCASRRAARPPGRRRSCVATRTSSA